MEIEPEKLNLLKLILNPQKQIIFNKLKNVHQKELTEWWDGMTKEEQNATEEELNKQIEGGDAKRKLYRVFDRPL